MRVRHQLAAYSPVSAIDVVLATAMSTPSSLEELRGSLARDFRAREVRLVGSGTHALQLALGSVGGGARQRPLVAAPAFSCFDIATAIIGAEVDVALYDVDPATLGPDLDSLRGALGNGAHAVILSPLYGVPFDWAAAVGVAKEVGALIIEDAAQGHGATWRGDPVGSLGDFSILSFSRGKGWTGGGGGALLARGSTAIRNELPTAVAASRLKTAVSLGLQFVFGRPGVYGIPRAVPGLALGETVYHEPSSVQTMGSLSATVLLRSLERARGEAAVRKANARALMELLSPGVELYSGATGGEAGYLRFPVRLPRGIASFADAGAAEALGIAPSYPVPLHRLPALAARRPAHGKLPGAEELASRLITLPTHSRLTKWELKEIAESVSRV